MVTEYHRPAGRDENISKLKHRRIVDIGHLITEARKLEGHECTKNPRNGHFSFQKEVHNGLHSTLHFKCYSCDNTKQIETVTAGPEELNNSAILGLLAIGKGHEHGDELTTFLDVPFMARNTYTKVEERVGDVS